MFQEQWAPATDQGKKYHGEKISEVLHALLISEVSIDNLLKLSLFKWLNEINIYPTAFDSRTADTWRTIETEATQYYFIPGG